MFRKKLARALSRGSPEPTNNPFFGAFMEPAVLHEVDATRPLDWMRARPDRIGLEPDEENFPEAAAAGRELAKGAYARRLREAQPIPRDEVEGTKVAGAEGLHLMNEIALVLRGYVDKGDVTPEDIDMKAPLTTCITAYSVTLAGLFREHWTS